MKVSDKDKQLVIAQKDIYISQTEQMLSDTNTYLKINRNPLPKMTQSTVEFVNKLSKKYEWMKEQLMPYFRRTPELYTTWKTHKNTVPPPMRPVVSQVDTPYERIAHFTSYILNQAMNLVKTNVRNTEEIKTICERELTGKIDRTHILFTADVTSLYTNVPVRHGLKVIMDFLNDNIENIDMHGVQTDDFESMLDLVVSSSYFRFNNDWYQQIDGLGMGVKPAPPFAIIYVYCTVELPLLWSNYKYAKNLPSVPQDIPKVLVWQRYVDDVFGLTIGDDNTVNTLFKYINTINSNIKFTVESSKMSIPFLDINIYLNIEEKKLDFGLYVKPSSKDMFLNYNSSHPKRVILNVAQNEIQRAILNSSNQKYEKESVERIREKLKRNDYPSDVIEKLIRNTRQKLTQKVIEPPTESKAIHKKYYLVVPYIDEATSRKVYYALRKANLMDTTRVTFKTDKTLKEKSS